MAYYSTGAATRKSKLKKYYWANDPVSSTNNSREKREIEELKILRDLKICQSIAMCAPYMDPESNKQTKNLHLRQLDI